MKALVIVTFDFFQQTTKCDSVFQIILSSMEFESKIVMRRVSCYFIVNTNWQLSCLDK